MAEEKEPQQIEIFPLATAGSIVWSRFPDHGIPGPSPKPRPALVIRSSPEENVVFVAYATTSKTDKIYSTEFLISVNDDDFEQTGLALTTKFDMGHTVQLPYNSEYFSVAPQRPGGPIPRTPRMGTLPASYFTVAKTAFEKANAPKKKKTSKPEK